ncbi:MFS transporter [Actinoplanes derwentensis]|uniref:Major Facilitator Superfamily protein n=1 Tax=Actinoplanes derwentensis TaxID=113562 RepID=A0A1H2C1N9_9ACTN|nr:MFS transporter [Actinoplanes derwentensis]GID84683.1 MFS transporter [Actinoplanes derwentensis]SDT64234.1 Major Facilitator Superfamily protein [Actinoplanes derwentensis]
MTTVESRPPATVPDVPNAPTKLIAAMALAMFGTYLTILTPVIVTLSIRVAQIAPDGKAAALGTVLSVGAVLALIGNPFFGAMSDRTTSRFGRRRPWLIGGMLLGFAGLLIVATGTTIAVLTAGWALAQLGVNATLATLFALLPDQIPARQRAKVSGILGLMTSAAILGGTALAAVLAGHTLLMFAVPAVIGIATVALLVAVLKDRPAEKGHFAPYRFKEFLNTFYVDPRRHPDFVWNIVSRFLIWMGLASVTTYQAYLLIDRFGYTTDTVAGGILIATLVSTAGLVVGSSVGGTLSDRLGRRKPFVLGAGLVLAVSLALIAFAGSFPVFLAASLIYGVGQGVYLAVDLALATDVLPDPDDAAKDMGVLNIANALPQSLVPILASPILAIGSSDNSNYSLLFLCGAVVALAGSLLVRMVRGAR